MTTIALLKSTVTRRRTLAAGLLLALGPSWARASERSDLERDSETALQKLYATNPKAAELGSKANAVLIFPKVVKAGFIVGGQEGSGVLFEAGRPAGYYRIAAASFGYQAGAQTFGYALFFMTPDSLAYLKKSDGWSIGTGPSVVLVDKGMARTLNTTTLSQAVYAMIFGQEGLMAGMGLQGSKITPIQPG